MTADKAYKAIKEIQSKYKGDEAMITGLIAALVVTAYYDGRLDTLKAANCLEVNGG